MLEEDESTYTQIVNARIREQFSEYKHSVIFGQNIIAGSRISGLGSNLESIPGSRVINTTNSENSLMGMGFGLSLAGMQSMYIMKQHDFALLGLDQLTNTHNLIRNHAMNAAFVVLMVVVDSGYEGPQASLNSLDEFASLTRAPVHYLTTKESIDAAFLSSQVPGLHFLALGQKSMKNKVLRADCPYVLLPEAILYPANQDGSSASHVVIIFGTGVDLALEVVKELKTKNVVSDLLVISRLGRDISPELLSKLGVYKTVVIIDSGKSEIHYSSNLGIELLERGITMLRFQRISNVKWSKVSDDTHEYQTKDMVELIVKAGVKD